MVCDLPKPLVIHFLTHDAEIARLSLSQDIEPPPPPPPNIHSKGIVAVDVFDKFSAAVKTLAPGELVKDGFFTLFEAVAALEIMDPKMDSGCVLPGTQYEELYDVSRPLLPEEVLGIIDQLLCHEISWQMGYPLSQTLLTSVYVEALLMPAASTIEEAQFVRIRGHESQAHPMLSVLRAYCLGMLKASGHINDRIRSEHYYEEEDFVTNTYNRNLLDRFSTRTIQKTLVAAEELCQSQQNSQNDELMSALIARLQLRRAFLDATESPEHMDNPELARKPWLDALALLPTIKNTHGLGTPVEESFSEKLQRKLASTMPPRPIVQLGFDDAFGHLHRLFRDGSEVIDVLNYTDSQCLQAKKPQPLVFVRTLLQTFLFHEMEILNSMSIRQLLDDDLSIITLPASPLLDRNNDEVEVVQDPRFVYAQQTEFFRQRAAQPFLDILRTNCQNRCRVRRTLCHSIRDWENLQLDAEEIDQIIQVKSKERPLTYQPSLGGGPMESFALPLSSWAYLYKLKLMEAIVQLGFELEVYQPDELAGMYWYLNYLAKSRVQHTERIKTFVIRRVDEARAQSSSFDAFTEEQLQRALAFSRLSLLDAAVTWELSDALSCIYTVLQRHKLVKMPERPYSSNEFRYEVRMKPFTAIGLPALPTFDEFSAGTLQPESSSEELLAYGERALAGAKRGFEVLSKLPAEESFSVGSHDQWLLGIKNGLKSCIATGLALSKLQRAIQNSNPGEELRIQADVPTPDKNYHEWWIIPKITDI
ncbi:LOW QUALITY PROTEIN: N-alpha-acetyltransferase 35, NatC auxiliary subunit [Paramyrothecium foliicola]|nr:LOW QUALITY PROTEIN: N-alpha-acetyltransferase 35, NatC auxiliary subunit [Paramyrothecium foliicola]